MEAAGDTLTCVDLEKKQDINKTLNEFKESLLSKDKESRVKWLEEKARSIYAYLEEGMPPAPISFDDLKEFSKILIEIQLLKKNIAKFEDEL